MNGCRGIISNHHRNITSDLCTSKRRKKNITQLVNDVTLNRKESGNDARTSERPEEKKSCVLVLSTSSLFCPLFVRPGSQYTFFCASPFLTFPLPELLPFFKGTGDQRNDQPLFLLPQLLLAKLINTKRKLSPVLSSQ